MTVPARLCALLIILLAPPAMSQTSPGELPPLGARAMWELKRLGDPAISPGIGQFAVIQAVAPSLGLEVSSVSLR